MEYAPDRAWGAAIILLSLLLFLAGLLGILFGGFLSTFGASFAAGSASAHGQSGLGAAALTAGVGIWRIVLGAFDLAIALALLAGGRLMMLSRTVGFQLVAVVAGLGALESLFMVLTLHFFAVFSLGFRAILFAYAVLRLTGRVGPKPASV